MGKQEEKKERFELFMSTESFIRRMFIPKEEMNHFLKIITTPAKSIKIIPNIEYETKEGRKLLEKYILKR